ncbi:hypothetical protein K8T06_03330 [bacterium]|nr:hypothetical protein [bacterium]
MRCREILFCLTVMIALVIPSATAQNMLLNPSFETWDSGLPVSWDGESSVTITQVEDPVYDALYSVGLEATSSSNRGIYQIVPITEGTTYEYSVYLFGPVEAGTLGIYLNWLDAGGSTIGGEGTFYNTGFGAYELVTTSQVQAPAGAVSARCRIRCYANTTFGGYADMAELVDRGPGDPTPTPTETPDPTATPTGPTPTPHPVDEIKINEVFINSPGTDSGTYVELYYPGGISLDGYSLVGVNGNGGADYQVIDLTGQTIPVDGYFVIAQDTDVSNYDMIDTNVNYQNGPDNIQLRAGYTIVDAIGYGSFSSAIFAGEGTPVPIISDTDSYSRIPDGYDTNNNIVDFLAGILTAGFANEEIGEPTPTPTPGEPTPTPTVTPTGGECINDGDVNLDGQLSAGDAQECFYIVLGHTTPTYEEECAADCNGDGEVTAGDAQNIFLAVLGSGSCADPV